MLVKHRPLARVEQRIVLEHMQRRLHRVHRRPIPVQHRRPRLQCPIERRVVRRLLRIRHMLPLARPSPAMHRNRPLPCSGLRALSPRNTHPNHRPHHRHTHHSHPETSHVALYQTPPVRHAVFLVVLPTLSEAQGTDPVLRLWLTEQSDVPPMAISKSRNSSSATHSYTHRARLRLRLGSMDRQTRRIPLLHLRHGVVRSRQRLFRADRPHPGIYSLLVHRKSSSKLVSLMREV